MQYNYCQLAVGINNQGTLGMLWGCWNTSWINMFYLPLKYQDSGSFSACKNKEDLQVAQM